MKEMTKRVARRTVTVFLTVAMFFSIIAPVTTVKAMTKSITLYKGEERIIYSAYKLKSVSSSRKSVVSAKKKNKLQAVLTAKKAGKATVTVKTQRTIDKYYITVKKLNVDCSFQDMGNGNLLLSVKNNTKQTFTSVKVAYTLKDSEGQTMEEKKKSVPDVVAGKTVYALVKYDSSQNPADIAQSNVQAVSVEREQYVKYRNSASSISVKDIEERAEDQSVLTITTKNKDKKISAAVTHYVLLYDANERVIGLKTVNLQLKPKKSKSNTVTISCGEAGTYPEYDHYKLVTVAYSTVF